MEKKNNKKGIISLPFAILALICAIGGWYLYNKYGVTNFTVNQLDALLLRTLVFGFVVNVVSLILNFKLVKYVSFLAYLYATLRYIVFEIDYITNVFVSIDGSTFTIEFIATLALLLVSGIFMLISAALTKAPSESNI